jgi:hypothetical protein
MSAALVESPGEELAVAKKSAARILNLCNTLENMRDEFLPRLPFLEDEVVIEVRMGARAVSVWAWVVEAACDAEMMSRVERLKGGRGNKDELEEGRLAVMRQQGYIDGKSPRTIERNVQIIETFGLETIATHGDTLQEKGFWIAAVSADDPFEAIEALAEKKADNPFMEVQDANKVLDEIEGKHDQAKQKFVEAFRTVARKAVGDWIRFTARPAIEQLKTNCPDTKLIKFWVETDEQLREREEAMLIEDAEAALIYAWTKGRVTESQMCEFTGLLPQEIRKTMKSLEERGYFVEQAQAWKPARARGSRVKEWQRTGKPLPNLSVVPE